MSGFLINSFVFSSGADTTPPTITSSSSVSVAENATLSFTITTDEAATITIGGTDAAQVELASNTLATSHTLRWSSNGTRDYEAPADANTDNVYSITITATDAATNASSPQSFAITVTDVSSTTWDPATVTNVTLSGGNLVATNTGTTSTDQGAHAPSTAGKTSGKWYFEVTFGASPAGGNLGLGIGTTASTYPNMGNSATTGGMVYVSGNIYANGGFSGLAIGARAASDVIGVAADLDNHKIWFKKLNGTPTSWNASSGGSNDPATNVGGVTIPSGTMIPFVTFGGSSGVSTSFTANFGATSFTGSVPSGFTSGWGE